MCAVQRSFCGGLFCLIQNGPINTCSHPILSSIDADPAEAVSSRDFRVSKICTWTLIPAQPARPSQASLETNCHVDALSGKCPFSIPFERKMRHEGQKSNICLLCLFTFARSLQTINNAAFASIRIITISGFPTIGRAQDQEVPGCEI